MYIYILFVPITEVMLHVESGNVYKLSWPPSWIRSELVPKNRGIKEMEMGINERGTGLSGCP